MAHTEEPWAIICETTAGWRIDSVNTQGLTGFKRVMNPVAIVPRKDDAELIILAPELLKERDKLLEEVKVLKEQLDNEHYGNMADKCLDVS